ncbi:MAG: hypothetical protein JXQ68_02560 [Campylobacterales bacterium]|nr:hypothetical protein [Campylobacterales bacterium]
MSKILTSIIFLNVITFASPAQDFLADINATYSSAFYEKLDIHKNTSLTLVDAETNGTQKKIKEDFERLLPKYLKVDDLFSKEVYDNDDTSFRVLSSRYREFFEVSILYLNFLSSPKEQGLHNRLLEKNLLNLHALTRLRGMPNYILSLVLHKKLYTDIECYSTGDYLLLQKYPPPDKTFFFVKLEEEKEQILHSYEGMAKLDELDIDVNKENYKKMMTQVSLAAKRYTEDSFKKMAKVLKLESQEKFKQFNQEIEEQSKKDLNNWTIVKTTLCYLKIKFYDALHIEHDYGCIADFMGKILGRVAMPRTGAIYFDYIDMLQDYNKKLKKCAQDNPTK